MPNADQQQAVMISIQRAITFIARHHRHHPPPAGAQLAVGITRDRRLVGVAILGRPVPPVIDDGATVEITRTGTAHHSVTVEVALYRAAWGVARAYGYRRLITHTHTGAITRGLCTAGLRPVATVPPRAGTHTPIGSAHGRGADGLCRTRWEAAGTQPATSSRRDTMPAASRPDAPHQDPKHRPPPPPQHATLGSPKGRRAA